MSDDTKNIDSVNADAETTIETNEVVDQSGDDLANKVADLEAELEKTKKNLEAARRGEKHLKAQKEQVAEQVKTEVEKTYQEQIDQLTKRVAEFEAKEQSSKLISALTEAGALDSTALVPLIKTVEDVAEFKTKHPTLFKQIEVPSTQRAAEGFTTNGYKEEMAAAMRHFSTTGSRQQIDAVNAKYQIKTY